RANSYRIRTRLLRHETDIEQTPQSIYHFIEVLWRCRSTDVKRSRNHTIELPVVFRPIRRNEQLLFFDGRPEGLGDIARRLHRGVEINIFQVDPHAARDDRVVEDRRDAERLSNLCQQGSRIATEMEVCPLCIRR